jgi:hypothetical protein
MAGEVQELGIEGQLGPSFEDDTFKLSYRRRWGTPGFPVRPRYGLPEKLQGMAGIELHVEVTREARISTNP